MLGMALLHAAPSPLLNVGNTTDVVEQCGITFSVLPQARTTFNIGERGKGDSVGGPGYSEAWIANSGGGTGINSPDVRDRGRQPYLIAVWLGILIPFLLHVTHDHMCRCIMVNHDT